MAKSKPMTITKAKEKAWPMFSKYIRLKASNQQGLVKCITCEAWGPWDIWAQAGHFIPGRGNAVLYDERQVHPQCYHCNCNLYGNWPVYLVAMTDMHGPKIVSEMILNSRMVVTMYASDHIAVFEKYSMLFKKLSKERGV